MIIKILPRAFQWPYGRGWPERSGTPNTSSIFELSQNRGSILSPVPTFFEKQDRECYSLQNLYLNFFGKSYWSFHWKVK